jgi:hypothetical protein
MMLSHCFPDTKDVQAEGSVQYTLLALNVLNKSPIDAAAKDVQQHSSVTTEN